ncbi:MAG TPA: Calx-beta domain-containing protein [Abditibacteriaceae bacterium]|jgi:hypothetical protein
MSVFPFFASRRFRPRVSRNVVLPFLFALFMAFGCGASPLLAQTIRFNDDSVVETSGGGQVAYLFTLTRTNETAARTVNYTLDNGGDAVGAPADDTTTTDYINAAGSVTFPANVNTTQISIPIIADGRDEKSETFFIALSSPGAQFQGNGNAGEDIAQVTILDDDGPAASIVATNSPITEGNSSTTNATFRISLSAASPETVAVRYTTANASATSGSDFVATNATATFAPGETTKIVTVPVSGDLTDENDENFSVNLSLDAAVARFATINNAASSATATIADDDAAPTAYFFPSTTQTGNEADSGASTTIPFVVRLSQPSQKTVTVPFATSNGTATAPADYVANTNGSLTFNPGQQSQTISIRIVGDDTAEADETFSVSLGAPTNAQLDQTGDPNFSSQIIGKILDNDTLPNLTVAAQPPSTTEGGNLTFVVTLDRPAPRTVTFMYRTLDGSATEGLDYTGAQNQTATITAGSSTLTLPITTKTDGLAEGPETFSLEVFGASGATISGGSAQAQGTINDGDGSPVISFDAVMPAITEGDTGTVNLPFVLTLNKPSALPITVTYSTSNGSAVAGADYNTASGTITIPAGSTTATINVAVRGDIIAEFAETLVLNLDSATNATVGDGARATGTITDNDLDPTLTINRVTVTEGGVATFTVSLTGNQTEKDITANYITVNGSATEPTDYVTANSSVPIPKGARTATFTVNTIDDSLDEPTENFTVNIIGVNATGTPTGIGTITDNDATPALRIADSTPTTEQDDATKTQDYLFDVSLSSASSQNVTFTVSTSSGTAAQPNSDVQPATSGSDFEPLSKQFTILAGSTIPTEPVIVKIKNDVVYEGTEQFFVSLNLGTATTATTATAQGGRGQATGTITDNEVAPKLTINPSTSINEGNAGATSTASFTVTLPPIGRPVVVTYTTLSTDTTTATAGTDYVAQTNKTLTFPVSAAAQTQKIDVIVNGDVVNEPDETFKVRLVSAIGAAIDADRQEATGIIVNDDLPAPTITEVKPLAGAPGTQVTITGTNFSSPVVKFPNGAGGFVTATNVPNTTTATSVTVTVPDGARSGLITVTTTNYSNQPADSTVAGRFTVLPTISDFNTLDGRNAKNGITPQNTDPDGNPGTTGTPVLITGRGFKDAVTPVLAVFFGTVRQTNFTVVSDTQIRTSVPRSVNGTVKLSIQVDDPNSADPVNTYTGPDSAASFAVNEVRTGGITYNADPQTGGITPFNVIERDTLNAGQQTRFLRLRAARQANGTPGTPVAPTAPIRVEIYALATSGSNPVVQVNRVNTDGTLGAVIATGFGPSGPAVVTFPKGAEANPSDPSLAVRYAVSIVNSGDDSTATSQSFTVKTALVDSEDKNYPNGFAEDIGGTRIDLHGIVVDTATVLRTSELGTNDPNGRGVAEFGVGLANVGTTPAGDPKNSNGSINIDARPKFDVLLTLRASNQPVAGGTAPGSNPEGVISYFVMDMDNDGAGPDRANGLVAIQPIPQAQQVFLYAVNVTSNEYYRNRHIARVTGVNDNAFDGDQKYIVTVDTAFSSDPEYNNLAFQSPVTLVNTDDETNNQQTGQPGFDFSRLSGVTTNENGSTDIFTVKLRTRPTGPVSLQLESNDLTEGRLVDPATGGAVQSITLTFTPDGANSGPKSSRWDIQQTVTVRGQNDSIQDGDQPYIVLTSSTSTDTTYNQINPPDVTAINLDNELPGATVSPTILLVNEGSAKTFTVVLNLQPTDDVVINLRSNNTAIGTIDKPRLIFTSSNFNQPQTVTVTGLDNRVNSADAQFTVILDNAQSSDTNYNGRNIQDVDVTVLNDDIPGITVTPVSGLVTTEAGGKATFSVRLNTQPKNNVTISVSTNDTTEGLVSTVPSATPAATKTLTFTAVNYDTPQVVTITGRQDSVDDGNVAYKILTANSASTDADYQGINPVDVSVTNTDDDRIGVIVTPSALSTSEAGTTASFTVRLGSQPSSNVTIAVRSGSVTEGTVSRSSLTFTTVNFNTPQTVVVTGVNDPDVDGARVYNVVLSNTVSDDSTYNNIAIPSVKVTNADNDVAGVNITPATGLVVTERGGTATFQVSLRARPEADVSLALSSSDASEGRIDRTSLTFTRSNYNVPQTVTVTGLADNVDDGDQPFTIVTGNQSTRQDTVSSDPDFANLTVADVKVTNTDIDTAAIILESAVGLETGESGLADRFTVALASSPSNGSVTLTVASNDGTEGTVSPTTLTFTSQNYRTPQTVTVTGVDDTVRDGDKTYAVRFTSSSTSPEYQGKVVSAPVINRDNESAGATVTPTSLTTGESGAAATFNVRLNSQPEAPVTITLTGVDTTEGKIDRTSLVFTAANFNTPQTVTVTGLDDSVTDGNIAYTIVTSATQSSSALYNGVAVADVRVTNTDNETAGVTVTPTTLSTTESGGAATFSISLRSRPASNVVINFSGVDTTEGRLSASSLTFTPENFATAQTVTVTGVEDADIDGTRSYVIVTAATSGSAQYNGISVADIAVSNTDNDSATINVSPTALNITENGPTTQVVVSLSARPTAEVTLVLASSDNTEAQLSTVANPTPRTAQTVRLNSQNYTGVTVTVHPIDDNTVDGTVDFQITGSNVVSDDPNFNGKAVPSVRVSNVDTDDRGVIVRPSTGETTESGGKHTSTVRLNSKPTGNVTLTAVVSDPNEATVSPASLTFTPENWNVERTVVVTGLNDNVTDGDQKYQVGFSIESTDPGYDQLYADRPSTPASISLINYEAGVSVSPTSGLKTSEGGTTTSFKVQLNSLPSANVVIGLSSSNTAEGTISPVSLTFTPQNGTTAQTVTVRGVDDTRIDGSVAYTIITSAAQSADTTYNGRAVADVAVVNTDNDATVPDNTTPDDYTDTGKTYALSVPYANSESATATTTVSQAFTVPPVRADGVRNYFLYRFDAVTQEKIELGNTSSIRRGEGYLLVPNARGAAIRRPEKDATRIPTPVSSFAITLRNFASRDAQADNNGWNLIGFPFDPAGYSKADWLSATVRTKDGRVFASVQEAADEGVMDANLFTLDEGNVTPGELVEVSNAGLLPFEGYYARTFEDGVVVTLRATQ